MYLSIANINFCQLKKKEEKAFESMDDQKDHHLGYFLFGNLYV